MGWGVNCIYFFNLELTAVRDDFTADLRLAERNIMLRVMVWWDGGGIFVIILYNFYLESALVRDDFTADLNAILRVKVRVELSLFCIISF